MLIYLVRHGHTALNGKGIIQGHLDPPLSPTGQHQSQQLGEHLKTTPFREVWSSDLLRSAQTAEGVIGIEHSKLVRVDARLRARYMGSIQGQHWTENLVYPDDVESDEALARRLTDWLNEVLISRTPPSSSASSPVDLPSRGKSNLPLRIVIEPEAEQDCILVVTHEECLLSLIGVLTGSIDSSQDDMPPSPLISTDVSRGVKIRGHLPNTAVAVLRVWWEDNAIGSPVPRGRVESWGQINHLI